MCENNNYRNLLIVFDKKTNSLIRTTEHNNANYVAVCSVSILLMELTSLQKMVTSWTESVVLKVCLLNRVIIGGCLCFYTMIKLQIWIIIGIQYDETCNV